MEVHHDTSTLVPPLSIAFSLKRSVFFDIISASISGNFRHLSPLSHPSVNLFPFARFFTHTHTFSVKNRVSCKVWMIQSS
jgi:hypothetical protein